MTVNSQDLQKKMLRFQKTEITEYHIYKRLAGSIKDKENSRILKAISEDELSHYNFWQSHTHKDVQPNFFMVLFFYWLARIFGLTFGLKLLERGEEEAQHQYSQMTGVIPQVQTLIAEEDDHEQKLIGLIQEERLHYVSSIVLGLNDALVELTGALAGFTFAMQNNSLVAMAGLITGISASFSMAASEYLSQKTETETDKAKKSALYTGLTYIITVVLLILPYFILTNPFLSLLLTLGVAFFIILIFTYYFAVARDYPFKKRFLEMLSISFGVALFSFLIGYIIRISLGIDI